MFHIKSKAQLRVVDNPPCPIRYHCTVDPEEVVDWRKIDCQHYDWCLDIAANANWDGFACTQCKAYEPMTRQQKIAEGLHIEGVLTGTGVEE